MCSPMSFATVVDAIFSRVLLRDHHLEQLTTTGQKGR